VRGGSVRPTRQGLAVFGLTAAVSLVALGSQNNLLFMAVSVLWVLCALSVGIGQWNLRGLSVVRELPVEFFAGTDAGGRLLLRNRRQWMPSMSVVVRDLDARASGFCTVVDPGQVCSLRVRWQFDRRGRSRLGTLRLESSFPFGLTRHVVDLPAPADIVVFPSPGSATVRPRQGRHEGEVDGLHGRSVYGEFSGMRGYRPGDREKAVHWRTSARVGEVVVVERAGEAEPYAEVRLDRRGRGEWEREISRATGEVLRAFSQGLRVGMVIDSGADSGQRYRAESGGAWRRRLLEALALQPGMKP
jgi:uncharacterized protein (DUF58 family)